MLSTLKSNHKELNVVVVGGTRGLGGALVRTFSKGGHKVLFTSRHRENIAHMLLDVAPEKKQKLLGVMHDVTLPNHNRAFKDVVQRHLPEGVDIWINNAAISDHHMQFIAQPIDKIEEILATNLFGSVIASHQALDMFESQPHRGHLFNIVGAGSDGMSTPGFSVYGATKAAVAQFVKTLRDEVRTRQGIHIISPGMMPTDLLAHNATPQQLGMFNILCEEPDVVAAYVYDQVIDIVKNNKHAVDIRYMTLQRILYHILTFAQRRNRFFQC